MSEAALECAACGAPIAASGGTLPVLRGADLVLHPARSSRWSAPSGSGKSTLLHLAGLLERPDGGKVLVQGAMPARCPIASARRSGANSIGFVYQFHHLLGEFSALENVVLPQMIAGKAARAAPERARGVAGGIRVGASALAICPANSPAASSSAWRSRAR